MKVLAAKSDEEEQTGINAYVDAVMVGVEPLLADTAPFFGGSSSLTLAEVRPDLRCSHCLKSCD